MQIKYFDFPSFEEWVKNKDCRLKLGCYNCHIRITYSWSNRFSTYAFGISTNINPLDVYAETIYHSYFHCESGEENELKKWYEKTIEDAKGAWERHLLKSYFENEETI